MRPDTEKKYAIWRFLGFTNINFAAGFNVSTRVLAQYSPHALIPGEQFGVGGGGGAMGGFVSVQGYRKREDVADYGTSEGIGTDFAKNTRSHSLTLRSLVFFDIG